MRRAYENWNPGADARQIIRQADAICRQYAAKGYDLTLRQLYYQFVARDLIPNSDASYSRLGAIINRARMSGELNWKYIVDRTRNLRGTSHWGTPADIIRASAQSFRLDKWIDQPRRVEVWVEKEALAGIVQRAAERWDVNWFSCRGYVSQSEQWAAGQRIGRYIAAGQAVTILHLGDHDPSGVDMTRDIRDRLSTFLLHDWVHDMPADYPDGEFRPSQVWEAMADCAEDNPFEVRRIALNRDQIRRYQPPPNPAKITDSRAAAYIDEHGNQSWELDALDPETLVDLICGHVEGIVDHDRWQALADEEAEHRALLSAASGRWRELALQLGGA